MRVVYQYLFNNEGVPVSPNIVQPVRTSYNNSVSHYGGVLHIDHYLERWVTLAGGQTSNEISLGYFIIPKGTDMPRTFAEIKSDLIILIPRAKRLPIGSTFPLIKEYTVSEVAHPINPTKLIWTMNPSTGSRFESGDRICFFVIVGAWSSDKGLVTDADAKGENYQETLNSRNYFFAAHKLNPDHEAHHFRMYFELDQECQPWPLLIVGVEDTWIADADRDFNDLVLIVQPYLSPVN